MTMLVTILDLLLYRLYFAPKHLGQSIARRWPLAGRLLEKCKPVVKRHILSDRHVWVRVQSGLSRGLWMRLHLPDEARYWRGEHEPELQRALSAIVQPGDVIYDIGCHIGYFALGAARLVSNSGHVVAFDGNPANVVRSRENGVRNHLAERLQLVNAAVWSYTATTGIPFRQGTASAQGGVEADGVQPVLAGGELINVPAITLDDFIASGGPVPQLIKIDVEGGEYEVLRGGTNLFAHQRPLIVAEVHGEQPARQIATWLAEHRYGGQWQIPKEQFPRHLFAWPIERDNTRLELGRTVLSSTS